MTEATPRMYSALLAALTYLGDDGTDDSPEARATRDVIKAALAAADAEGCAMSKPAYFNADHFKPGQPITYAGFAGSIVRYYGDGIWEVRVPGGVAAVSGAEITP